MQQYHSGDRARRQVESVFELTHYHSGFYFEAFKDDPRKFY
jgi:hypothetical protein